VSALTGDVHGGHIEGLGHHDIVDGKAEEAAEAVLVDVGGVSRVSLVLAALRVLSPRLVAKGCCAKEDDRKAMQTSTVRQRLRAGVELNIIELNIQR